MAHSLAPKLKKNQVAICQKFCIFFKIFKIKNFHCFFFSAPKTAKAMVFIKIDRGYQTFLLIYRQPNISLGKFRIQNEHEDVLYHLL